MKTYFKHRSEARVCLLTLFILSFLGLDNLKSQPLRETDPFNLGFHLEGFVCVGWESRFPTIYRVDTTQVVEGKYPLQCGVMLYGGLPLSYRFKLFNRKNIAMPFDFQLNRSIPLPDVLPNQKVVVSINNRCSLAKEVWLGVSGFDDSEKLVYCDSIDINNNDQWQKKSLSFQAGNVKLLRLFVKGYGDSVVGKRSVWLDKIQIEIEGKELGDYPVPSGWSAKKLDRKQVVPISIGGSSPGLAAVDALADPNVRIVALGESLHGSENINQLVLNSMKELVKRGDVSVIVLEKGCDLVLKWDRYVRGLTPDSTLNELVQEVELHKISHQGYIDFLQWLRSYNQDSDRKIRLFGMDDPATPDIFLVDYLALLNPNGKDPNFGTLLNAVWQEDYRQAIGLIRNSEVLKCCLNNEEQELLLSVLESADTKQVVRRDTTNLLREDRYFDKRDSRMFTRIDQIIQHFLTDGGRMLLAAHSGHVDRISSTVRATMEDSQPISCGRYLAQQYGSQYYALSVQVGGGVYPEDVGLFRTQQMTPLVTPPADSFERMALEVDLDCFFYPTSALPDGLSGMRFLSREHLLRDQFARHSLKNRFDGFLFIRESEPLNNKKISVDYSMGIYNKKRANIKRILQHYFNNETDT